MKRDEKVSFYVTEQRKEKLERQAEAADMTVSSFVNQLVDRQLLDEAQGDVAVETRAVEQLQEVIDRGTRQLRDATKDMREMQAKTGAYAIANFEFLKKQRGETEINDALATGARRLREVELPDDPEDDDQDEDESDGENSMLDRIE